MILIKLTGYLQELYPEGVKVAARTGREALQLLATFPGFRKEDGRRHLVRVDPLQYHTDFDLPLPEDSTLTVNPVVLGAGGGSASQIVIGALMIVAAFTIPSLMPELVTLAEGGTVASMLFNIGASMVLGGVLQHLSRAPKADPLSGGDKRSRFISSTKNTVAAGTNIPLAYGKVKLGGHFLSFDVDAEDYVPE